MVRPVQENTKLDNLFRREFSAPQIRKLVQQYLKYAV